MRIQKSPHFYENNPVWQEARAAKQSRFQELKENDKNLEIFRLFF